MVNKLKKINYERRQMIKRPQKSANQNVFIKSKLKDREE